MFEALTNWVAGHATEMLFALLVTGTITLASHLDAMVRDARDDAPLWLRILSRVISMAALNVGKAKNCPVAQLKKLSLVVCVLLAPFALGCASVHQDGVRAGGMAEAYRLAGPQIDVAVDGTSVCTTDDPAAQPCTIEYAGSSELWAPIVEVLAVPFEAVLQLFGRTLAPAVGVGHGR